MPNAVPVPNASRRLSQRFARLRVVRVSARWLLRWLLLGPYGTFVCTRRDECALDRAARASCPFGEYSYRIVDRACRRAWLHHCRRLDVVVFEDVMSRPLGGTRCVN